LVLRPNGRVDKVPISSISI